MTNNEYHAAEGVSSSQLSLLEESPFHLINASLFSFEPSQAMALGTLVHALVLEPGTFSDNFIISGNHDSRTKLGKIEKENFIATAGNKIIVTQDDYAKASKMAANVLDMAQELFIGEKEHPHFTTDHGVILKCKPDCHNLKTGIVTDLKTTSDISDNGIIASIKKYRYDRQAAFYLKVLQSVGLPANDFIFVFVSSSAPHLVKIRKLHKELIDQAGVEINSLLAQYRDYLDFPYTPIKTIDLLD